MGTQGHNTDALLQLLGDMWLHARSEWKIPLIRWSFPPWPMTPGETDKSFPFTTETLLVLTYCFTTLRRSRFRVPFPIKTHSLIIQGSRWNHPHEQGIGESREEVAAISDRQLMCLASLSQHHDLTACGTPALKAVRHEHMGAVRAFYPTASTNYIDLLMAKGCSENRNRHSLRCEEWSFFLIILELIQPGTGCVDTGVMAPGTVLQRLKSHSNLRVHSLPVVQWDLTKHSVKACVSLFRLG